MRIDDRQRFEELFRSHHGAVRAYVRRRVAGDAAQDAVAETFLVAWRRRDDVPEDALPWLFAVARRVLSNERRGAARAVALQARVTAAEPRTAEDLADRVAEDEAIRLALARLGDRDRETLMHVAWEGLEPARAARASGCTRAAFAVRLHRARRRLGTELEALAPGPSTTADLLEAS
jgi:RNA polymerase sigma-70 factor (ECF subfamily)